MSRRGKHVKKSRLLGVILNVLIEIILAGVFLCIFALPHHVLTRLIHKNEVVAPIYSTQPPVQATDESKPAQQQQKNDTTGESVSPSVQPSEKLGEPDPEVVSDVDSLPDFELEPEPEPEPEPDPFEGMTEWQIKFHDKFTDEVIITDNSYSSPYVSVTVEKFTTEERNPVTYFVADIYIASIENFRTHLAGDSFRKYASEPPVESAKKTNGIITINGDYCDNYIGGFVVRNGEVYFKEQTTMDICVMYYDGTVKTFGPKEYVVEDILADNPYQVWYFGPGLLDSEGNLKETYNTGNWVGVENPRSAFGYYEPGHYCFVLVDGRREGYSRGFDIYELAQLFKDLGCTEAYNMDGGASAVMTFNYQIYNRPTFNMRDCGDILLICDTLVEENTDEGLSGSEDDRQ